MEILRNQTQRRTWDRHALDGSALQQDWAYGDACAALGSTVLRAEIRDGGALVGLIQLIHRPFFGWLNAVVGTRGPLWNSQISGEEIALGLRKLNETLPLPRLRGLFLTPDAQDPEPLQSSGYRRVMTPYATAEIDLRLPVEELRSAMHQKWRNRLVAAEAVDLTVRRIDARPEHYAWLLEAEAKQQTRIGYRALPPDLVPAWQHFGGRLRIYAAEHQDQIVAAMVFLLHGSHATYHIGWSNEDGRRLSAHNLLLWHAVRKLPKLGISKLDLGGINTHDSPGIARFKLGAGGKVKRLCGTWFHR